jgi:hypothetical protein
LIPLLTYISFRRTVPLSGKSQRVQYQQNQLTVLYVGKANVFSANSINLLYVGKALIQYQQYQSTYEKDMCSVPTMPSVVSHRHYMWKGQTT